MQILFIDGATSIIDFQSKFKLIKGDGKFISVTLLVTVLHCHIFWTETMKKIAKKKVFKGI